MFEKLNALHVVLNDLRTAGAPQESINAVVSAIKDEKAKVLREYARQTLPKVRAGHDLDKAIFTLDGWEVTSMITSALFESKIQQESVQAEMIAEIFVSIQAEIEGVVDGIMIKAIKNALIKRKIKHI